MKKNIIIIILIIFCLISIRFNIIFYNLYNAKNNFYITDVKDGNLNNYQIMLDGYIPDNGYVPDAKTAAKIAAAVIGATLTQKGGKYIVEYDKINKVWIVQNYFLVGNSQYVIIKQSDGSIISAWGTK